MIYRRIDVQAISLTFLLTGHFFWWYMKLVNNEYIDGLVQDCSNSIANALELLQSCTKPSICFMSLSHYTLYKPSYSDILSGKIFIFSKHYGVLIL